MLSLTLCFLGDSLMLTDTLGNKTCIIILMIRRMRNGFAGCQFHRLCSLGINLVLLISPHSKLLLCLFPLRSELGCNIRLKPVLNWANVFLRT